jgi:hypothetical protein
MNFIGLIFLVIKPTERFGKLANIFADLPTKNKHRRHRRIQSPGCFSRKKNGQITGVHFWTISGHKNTPSDPENLENKGFLIWSQK